MQLLKPIQSYALNENTIHLWIVELPHWVKKARFQELHQLKVKRRRILEDILKHYTSTPLVFRETASGKPYLEGQSLQFNTSHSGQLFAIAVHINAPIGVDIEYLKIRDFKQFGSRFWGESFMNQHIINHHSALQTLAFFRAWTQTEAWVKLKAQTIFQFDDFVPQQLLSSEPWFYHHQQIINITPNPGYTMSLCMPSCIQEVHYQTISFEEM